MKAKILALSVIGSISIFFSLNLAAEELHETTSKKAHLSQPQTTVESTQQLVVQIESGYLSTEFTRSLLSQPTLTVTAWVTQVYQWMVIDSDLQGWIAQQNQAM